MWFISNERDFSVGVKRQPNLWKKRDKMMLIRTIGS